MLVSSSSYTSGTAILSFNKALYDPSVESTVFIPSTSSRQYSEDLLERVSRRLLHLQSSSSKAFSFSVALVVPEESSRLFPVQSDRPSSPTRFVANITLSAGAGSGLDALLDVKRDIESIPVETNRLFPLFSLLGPNSREKVREILASHEEVSFQVLSCEKIAMGGLRGPSPALTAIFNRLCQWRDVHEKGMALYDLQDNSGCFVMACGPDYYHLDQALKKHSLGLHNVAFYMNFHDRNSITISYESSIRKELEGVISDILKLSLTLKVHEETVEGVSAHSLRLLSPEKIHQILKKYGCVLRAAESHEQAPSLAGSSKAAVQQAIQDICSLSCSGMHSVDLALPSGSSLSLSFWTEMSKSTGALIFYSGREDRVRMEGSGESLCRALCQLGSKISDYASCLYSRAALSSDGEFITGKKDGKLIKVMRATGTSVTLQAKGPTDSATLLVVIKGNRISSLVQAIDMMDGEMPASLSFYIPECHHKRMIGHGGKHIQKWMKTFGVYVKFINTSSLSPLPDQRKSEQGNEGRPKENVLVKTPFKNAPALVQMKNAILDLAGEEDMLLEEKQVSAKSLSLLDVSSPVIYIPGPFTWTGTGACFATVLAPVHLASGLGEEAERGEENSSFSIDPESLKLFVGLSSGKEDSNSSAAVAQGGEDMSYSSIGLGFLETVAGLDDEDVDDGRSARSESDKQNGSFARSRAGVDLVIARPASGSPPQYLNHLVSPTFQSGSLLSPLQVFSASSSLFPYSFAFSSSGHHLHSIFPSPPHPSASFNSLASTPIACSPLQLFDAKLDWCSLQQIIMAMP